MVYFVDVSRKKMACLKVGVAKIISFPFQLLPIYSMQPYFETFHFEIIKACATICEPGYCSTYKSKSSSARKKSLVNVWFQYSGVHGPYIPGTPPEIMLTGF